ncbi:hypothetical protein KC19_8G111300 [Ceratodon purpureus]|uniref:Uncharacterized protein n=1 Tax=Ceratodon purpureus TaxID=3225 RepID=A0A8T0H006_CERPU|nr:hypothetical protein KC19_8G111300 [Ceratodon purpureus]
MWFEQGFPLVSGIILFHHLFRHALATHNYAPNRKNRFVVVTHVDLENLEQS